MLGVGLREPGGGVAQAVEVNGDEAGVVLIVEGGGVEADEGVVAVVDGGDVAAADSVAGTDEVLVVRCRREWR
jgi:hypothetical protein